MKLIKFVLAIALISSTVFIACSKESRTSTLQVKLTDAPADWEEVNIDLKAVKVNFWDDSTGWVTLETKDTIYNLLGLQNGLDTLIAQETFPTNTVREIRLVLGQNNTIKAKWSGLSINDSQWIRIRIKNQSQQKTQCYH